MTIAAVFGAIAALLPSAAAAASPGHANLTIRYQVRGCHEWSLNAGRHRAFVSPRGVVA